MLLSELAFTTTSAPKLWDVLPVLRLHAHQALGVCGLECSSSFLTPQKDLLPYLMREELVGVRLLLIQSDVQRRDVNESARKRDIRLCFRSSSELHFL